ncbi:MAG TPA: AbrB/MazE/SpoVT family DNA-binding domain-containing protein, partial [Candidatus Tectomicrobia bacterium]
MPVATLTSKGQLVIPKDIREYLHLQPGDRLDFIIRDDGDVILRPVVTDVCELKSLLHKPGRQPGALMAMQNV